MKIENIDYWMNDKNVLNKIIEKNCNINLFDDWFSEEIDLFVEEINKFGFEVDEKDVIFTGFNSQGDGASFTGNINIIDYLKGSRQLSKYRSLVLAINNNKVDDTVSISRINYHYSHENSCSVDDIEVYDDLTIKQNLEVDKIAEELEEKRLELCNTLFSDLKKLYDEITSEESIIETLRINEYQINEEGDIV